MMSAVVLETCWGDNVIYILQNKKLGASSWSQKLIYITMHGQRNIKKLYLYIITYFISQVVRCPGREIDTKHSHHLVPRPHTVRQMAALLQQFEWECLEHLLYSPEIAPSDFSILSKVY
jgi:hypothetical protein